MKRQQIKDKKRWVIKVGSALLTDDGQRLNNELIRHLAEQIVWLRTQGIEVVLVSSGSVAAGMSQLNISLRPSRINELQAAAAVGQATLVRSYEQAFKPFSVNIAQVLLTHADIANRERYLNARSTLMQLLELDVLTVINENDTVATEEICFGDNDSLAALVANLVDADLLIILTDQQGLYTDDPRVNPDATLISKCDADDSSLMAMASGGGMVGRGGMVTKLTAAQKASHSGASTVIAYGREPQILSRLYQGDELGTLLVSKQQRLAAKKQWMAGQMRIQGTLILDDGAATVLKQSGCSLLPVGVSEVEGNFKRGELVRCVDLNGVEIARGLINYHADEVNKIKGQASDCIELLLGYGGEQELIHRDNLVLI